MSEKQVQNVVASIQSEGLVREAGEKRHAIIEAAQGSPRTPVSQEALGEIGALVRTEQGDLIELDAELYDTWNGVLAVKGEGYNEHVRADAMRVETAIRLLEKGDRHVIVERAGPPAAAPERPGQPRSRTSKLSDAEIRDLVTIYGHQRGLKPADYARVNSGPKIGDKLGEVVVLIRDAPGRASYEAIGRVLGGRSKQAVQKLERRGRRILDEQHGFERAHWLYSADSRTVAERATEDQIEELALRSRAYLDNLPAPPRDA